MIFFKKKKEEKVEEAIESVKIPEKSVEKKKEVIEEPRFEEKIEAIEEKKAEKEKPKKMEKKPAFAPLFVKIDRYRSVLDVLTDLKTTLIMIKNALGLQKQIESIREENRKLLESAINKIDKKILSLDSEFLRPKGYEEEFPSTIREPVALEGVVTDLKKQIEGLKSELKAIS